MKIDIPFKIGQEVIVREIDEEGKIEYNKYIYDGPGREGHRFGYTDDSDDYLYFDLNDVFNTEEEAINSKQ